MAKLRRTLLIGLGGTGYKSILNAKKLFYENYGEIPPMIGFLAVDTDAPGLNDAFVIAKDGKKISLSASEQLLITVEEPRAIYQQNKSSNLFDWLPMSNVEALDRLTIGAGQTRSNGRFALTVNEAKTSQTILRKISEINDARIIDNPRYGLLSADTEVHIVFSLGGGTGSGTFLNMAYLVRRIQPNVKLSGYAVMADIFRDTLSKSITARVRANAEGAIRDLDFLAHLNANSEPVEVKWFHETDSVSKRPFDALYMIDNRNANHDSFREINHLCQMVALAIVTSVGEIGVALGSISDNVSKWITDGVMDVNAKKAWVAGLGCAEIIFDGFTPARLYQIKAVQQLIDKMLNGGCQDPAQMANAWLDNEKIRENQGKDDVINYFMAPQPPFMFSDIDDLTNPEPGCRHFVGGVGIPTDDELNGKLDALKNRIDLSLAKLMNDTANSECGVYLCENILKSLLVQLELCDGEMVKERETLQQDQIRMDSALHTACQELAECMSTLFKKGKKDFIEAVCERTMGLTVVRREIIRRELAHLFYGWLRERINQSLRRVDIIMENLRTVRDSCTRQIQELLYNGSAPSFFQFDLARNTLDKVVCNPSDVPFNNFVISMRNKGGVASFASKSSIEVEAELMEFADGLPQVKAYKDYTVDNALDALSEAEITDLVRRAVNKTVPLLPYSYRGYEAQVKSQPEEAFFIGVADENKSRLKREDLILGMVGADQHVEYSNIGLRNRIIIYRQIGVVPAFTLRALDAYNTEYNGWEKDKPQGSHWNSRLCDRMEKERYSLFPKDEVNEKKLLETWVTAIILDIISYNPATKQYQIASRGLGGSALRKFKVDMGATRDEAFRFLEDNLDVLGKEIAAKVAEMNVPGPDNPVRVRTARACASVSDPEVYLREVSKCPIPFGNIELYPAEAKLIEKEINFILDNLEA